VEESLLLIDGSALAHRSYFAFKKNPLFNSRGEDTSAVYGYLNSLLKMIDEYKPSHAAVCFDTAAPTFRHRMFGAYKATREKMEPEMRIQLPAIHDVTLALGVPVVELDGFEADDVMGTLATKAAERGYTVCLVSGDKDFLQLVGENIRVVSPGRTGGQSVTYDRDKVKEKYDVPPERIVDLLALAGDKVDNIPGVEGIGAKGAAALIRLFGPVEEVLARSSEIDRESLRERIVTNREKVLLSKELVTIKVDVPVELGVDDLALRKRDGPRLRNLLKRLEFFSLLKKLDVQKELGGNYLEVRSADKLPGIGPSTERIGLFIHGRHGIAVSTDEGDCRFIHRDLVRTSEEVRGWLSDLVSSGRTRKISEDSKSLSRFLSEHGMVLAGPLVDTSVASYLLDPDRRDHSLSYHTERELGLSIPSLEERGRKSREDLFGQNALDACCSRADAALRVESPLRKRLEDDGLLGLFLDVEMPLVRVLADMEETGVLVDVDFLNEMSGSMGQRLEEIEEEIYELAGERFNVRSSKQLASILFEKLGLPCGRKTKTGYSTSQDLLEQLSEEHELPGTVLKYREIYKLKSTYVDALPGLVSDKTGRIHTTFNQTVAATGRLSSSEPNLQNIPMRSDLGREIRKAFIAGEGSLLLSLDYSQIELRILAHLSGEERLKEAFENGEDVHRETAALVFGVKPVDVTPEMRDTAKMVNYGLVYGMSVYGLSQRLNIDRNQARQFVDAYFASLPGIKEWKDSVVEFARLKGYTTTMMGRRRYHRDISSRDSARREFAVRAAINSPIQGSAADMIKKAMVAIHGRLSAMDAAGKMIIQIHDELLFEVPEDEIPKVEEMAKHEMVDALKLDVPVEVEVGRGPTWYSAHR
jgi:DNA polymerase-1